MKKAPMDPAQELYLSALVLAEEGEYDAAILTFKECLKIDPGHARAHCQLGQILCDQGNLGEAEKEFREAMGFKARFKEAYVGLAECLLAMERYEEGKICLKKALELETNPAQRKRLQDLLARQA